MTDLRHADVVCSGCERRYVCTPADDYYNATTTTDGVCFDCLTAGIASRRVVVVVGDVVVDHGEAPQ